MKTESRKKKKGGREKSTIKRRNPQPPTPTDMPRQKVKHKTRQGNSEEKGSYTGNELLLVEHFF